MVWFFHHTKNAYGLRICFVLFIKPKYARCLYIIVRDDMWCDAWFQLYYFLLDCIFFVLSNKTKICKIRNDGMSHVIIFRSKNPSFFLLKNMRPLCSQNHTSYTSNNFVIYSIRICTRVEKFLRNGHRWCPKSRSTKDFWENSTRTRCFAELFWINKRETIYAVMGIVVE